MDQNSKLITLGLNEWLFRRNYSPENKKVRKLFHWQRTSWSNERTDSIKPTCYQIWGRFSETFCETSTSNGYLFLVLQFVLKFEPKLSHFADQIVKTYPTPSNDPTSFKHSQNWEYTLNTWGQIAVVIGSELRSGRFCDTFEVIAWCEANLSLVRLSFQTFSPDLFDLSFKKRQMAPMLPAPSHFCTCSYRLGRHPNDTTMASCRTIDDWRALSIWHDIDSNCFSVVGRSFQWTKALCKWCITMLHSKSINIHCSSVDKCPTCKLRNT